MSDTAASTFDLSPETCAAYQALCSFCSWGLYGDPDEAALRGLAAERAMFSEPPFSQVAPEAAAAFGELLAVLDDGAGADDDVQAGADAQADADGRADAGAARAFLDEVRRDRSYLFYMVGSSRTSPFESVYRTDDHTMMGPTTLEVRAAYSARGLVFDRNASEPDDHIGLEFSFVAHLLGQAAAGDASAFEACRDFLARHLLVFAPVYLDLVEKRARSAYYRSVAGIARGSLASLADALGVQAVEAPAFVPPCD